MPKLTKRIDQDEFIILERAAFARAFEVFGVFFRGPEALEHSNTYAYLLGISAVPECSKGGCSSVRMVRTPAATRGRAAPPLAAAGRRSSVEPRSPSVPPC